MRATVYFAASLIMPSAPRGSSQVELNAISVFSRSRIRNAWSVYVFALASISSRESAGRVTLRPVGSPIIPVKSPITKMMW